MCTYIKYVEFKLNGSFLRYELTDLSLLHFRVSCCYKLMCFCMGGTKVEKNIIILLGEEYIFLLPLEYRLMV